MPDLRPIAFILGLLHTVLGLAMLVPVAADALAANPDWQVFLAASALTTGLGVATALANRGISGALDMRQAFLLTSLAWIMLPAFAALPLAVSELDLSYTDAYFEAMSGLTTTGSTVIVGLDGAPPGLLLWRALLQWLGGVGVIVMAIAILPILQVGGMQLFRMESSEMSEKVIPRAAEFAGSIAKIYLGLSAVCFFALLIAGLDAFDALAHMMTTIATGGFSTRDGSIGHFASAAVDGVVIAFMIVGSLPFILYFQLLRGRPLALWRDSQVRWFFLTVAALIALVSLYLAVAHRMPLADAVRYGSFNIVSVMTGTGFSTTAYDQWGGLAVSLFFFAMFIGGCAGSTTCGIKIFRFQVLFNTVGAWIRRLNRPHGVFVPHYNRRPIPAAAISSVMSFLFLFLAVWVALSVGLAMAGLDYITALSGAGTALANVGPGLGSVIGPTGNFASLPDPAKWLLSLGMMMGRLELFTVLVLLTPAFWRG